MVTPTLTFNEWIEILGSERLTGALLDRLTHRVHLPEMDGNSFRLEESKCARQKAASTVPCDSRRGGSPHGRSREIRSASPRSRPKGLRHTAITNYRAAGVEEGTIMAMSGHKSRSVFDWYGIQPEDRLHDAVRRLEEQIRTKDGQTGAETHPDDSSNPTASH